MSITYEGSKGQVERFAARVLRRLRAAGERSFSLSDIQQELWAAWCKARDNFDPQAGVPFAAYLQRGMMNHINRMVESSVRDSWETPISLDAGVDGEEGTNIGDAFPDHNAERQDERVFSAQVIAFLRSHASPMALSVIEILADPPQELMEEFRACTAKAHYARERGFQTFINKDIRYRFIADFLGFDTGTRRRVFDELKRLAEDVSRLEEVSN